MTDNELLRQEYERGYMDAMDWKVQNHLEHLPPRQQEPVAWYRDEDGVRMYYDKQYFDDAKPLYSAQREQKSVEHTGNGTAGREADVRPTGFFFQMPAQREWVGLTDEEMFKLWVSTPAETEDRFAFARAVEAKLREKNT